MEKDIHIIGAGMGPRNLTNEGMEAIASAEAIFGAPRLLEIIPGLLTKSNPPEAFAKQLFPLFRPEEVSLEIRQSKQTRFAILVSGDAGFFSGAAALRKELMDYKPRIIPGISCVNALSAKLGIPWQDFRFVSLHGADANIVEMVRRHPYVLCLTDGNTAEIGRRLSICGLGGVKISIAENLGAENEAIRGFSASSLPSESFSPLATLLIHNENFDNRAPSGLPDDSFARLDGVPMTKSEVRAVISSKLNLPPGAVCYDVGAGTGSVSVEMALAAYEGHVFAIEPNEKAQRLIWENLSRFHIGNTTIMRGKAPSAFEGLPAPDAAFIGGGSGETESIIKSIVSKNPKVRIVLSAITIESAARGLTAMSKVFPNTEMLQIQVSKAKLIGVSHIMTARNPVFILSGGGL